MAAPKCKKCKQEVDKTTEHIKNYKGYFHKECFDESTQKTKSSPKHKCKICSKVIQDKGVTSNKQHYHENCYSKQQQAEKNRMVLCEYIAKKRGISFPPVFILMQIKQMKEKYKFSYSEMYKTLYYAYEIKQMPMSDEYGIGIIPYLHDKAQDFFKENQRLRKVNKGKTVKTDIIYRVSANNNADARRKNLIDISLL